MSGLTNAFAGDTSGTALPGSSDVPAFDRATFDYEDDLEGSPPAGGGGERPPQPTAGASVPDRRPAQAPSAGQPAGQQGAPPSGDPSQSPFTDEHFRIAGQFGLSREDVQRFGTPDALDVVLGRMYASVQRQLQQSAPAGGQVQNPGNPGPQVPEQGARQPAPSQPAAGMSQFSPFDRKQLETLDPEDRGLFEKVISHYEAPLQQLIGRLEAYEQQIGQMQFAQEVDAFDRQIAGLGETWADLLGKGATYDLDPGSPEARNRDRVFEEMDTLRHVYSNTGRPVPPAAKLFDTAVRGLFGDRFKQEARQQIKSQIRDQAGRFASQPTHVEGAPLSPEDAAVRYAEAKQREIGLRGSDDDVL